MNTVRNFLKNWKKGSNKGSFIARMVIYGRKWNFTANFKRLYHGNNFKRLSILTVQKAVYKGVIKEDGRTV